jgi:outer membrane protein OmpA-like peptidoglycan-associated protein
MKTQIIKHSFLQVMLFFIFMSGNCQEKEIRLFNDAQLKIAEIKTNTIRSDFGPAIVGDSLYFTTYSDKVLGVSDSRLRANAFYDLYRSDIDLQGNTLTPRLPIMEFYTKYHDGPVTWCKKTGELFVTESDNTVAARAARPFEHQVIRLRIIIAKQIKGKWETILNFPYNNPAYSVGHPAITESGDTLVFSSDIPGGYGETDLYCTIRKDGKWGMPFNLGAHINTSGKEEFSFITDKNLGGTHLIFSSTGRFGSGGLDLYYTKFPNNNDPIEHFNAPLNSEMDDFAMVIPTDAEFGYLTSNRPGTGSDDIYKFNFKRFPKPRIVPKRSPIRELYVFNKRSLLPIMGSKVVYCDKQTYVTDKGGKIGSLQNIEMDCDVLATKFGYPATTKSLIAKEIINGEIPRDTVWLNPIMGKKITLLNIYYDLDKWDILPEAAQELDQLVSFMNENPDFTVELGSHTDSRATEQYNLKLSQRRAESAVNYIVSQGIAAARISGTGYGESQLLNRCADGVNCAPEEHRQNRRTEIYIPDFGKAKDVKQTKGDYSYEVPNRGLNEKKIIEQKVSIPNQPAKTMGIKSDSMLNKEIPNQPAKTMGIKSDSIINKDVPIKNKTKNIYIILGSCNESSACDRMIRKLKAEGYKAEIVTEKNGVSQIGIVFENLKEAKKNLEGISGNIKTAWILME